MKRLVLSLSIGLFALLLFSSAATAAPLDVTETTVLRVSASTCYSCWGNNSLPNITIDALLTVTPDSGTYWDPWYQSYLQESVLLVTGVTGMLNIDGASYPMSFLQPDFGGDGWSAPRGEGSYLWLEGTPRYVVFSAGGSGLNTRLINDNAFNLFQWSSPVTGFGDQVPVLWSVTRVPEASSLQLLAFGMGTLFIVAMKLTRLNRDRHSACIDPVD